MVAARVADLVSEDGGELLRLQLRDEAVGEQHLAPGRQQTDDRGVGDEVARLPDAHAAGTEASALGDAIEERLELRIAEGVGAPRDRQQRGQLNHQANQQDAEERGPGQLHLLHVNAEPRHGPDQQGQPEEEPRRHERGREHAQLEGTPAPPFHARGPGAARLGVDRQRLVGHERQQRPGKGRLGPSLEVEGRAGRGAQPAQPAAAQQEDAEDEGPREPADGRHHEASAKGAAPREVAAREHDEVRQGQQQQRGPGSHRPPGQSGLGQRDQQGCEEELREVRHRGRGILPLRLRGLCSDLSRSGEHGPCPCS